jgi:hypothetical protein
MAKINIITMFLWNIKTVPVTKKKPPSEAISGQGLSLSNIIFVILK